MHTANDVGLIRTSAKLSLTMMLMIQYPTSRTSWAYHRRMSRVEHQFLVLLFPVLIILLPLLPHNPGLRPLYLRFPSLLTLCQILYLPKEQRPQTGRVCWRVLGMLLFCRTPRMTLPSLTPNRL